MQLQLAAADQPTPVEAILPDEGSTGWSDTWMMAKDAAHPNCMLKWMDHMMSAEANAQATVWFGEAPHQPGRLRRCRDALDQASARHYHAQDEAYFANVHYWATPQEDCADADPATTCKTQDDWVNAWTTLRGQ